MKVAIAGYGLEGESSYRYYLERGHDVTVFDESENPGKPLPKNAKVQLGKNVYDNLNGYDLVVRTAGLNPGKIKTDGKIWSSSNEFLARVKAPVIGVTGTKGKGTTASFIYEILRASGRGAHLVGNVGIAPLDVLPKINDSDVVVFELSSFQLWDISRSPHVAVILMIEPDHLDVHNSLNDYIFAKTNIARWQKSSDTAIYNPSNKYSTDIARQSNGSKLPYLKNPGCIIQNGKFVIDGLEICATQLVKLPGRHNLENAAAAITAAWQFTHDTEAIARGIETFHGLDHRLKLVRNVRGVKYYDDSIATTPGSAIAAINAFNDPKLLILGGHDKGADYNELVSAVTASDTIRAVVTMGKTGKRISDLLTKEGFEPVISLPDGATMHDAVSKCNQLAKSGDTVILSPAASSFDMYSSYIERGNKFIAAVQEL